MFNQRPVESEISTVKEVNGTKDVQEKSEVNHAPQSEEIKPEVEKATFIGDTKTEKPEVL